MYSVFFSKIEIGIDFVQERLKKIIPKNSIVLVLPWAFPKELDANQLENVYFKKDEPRYNRYIDSLKKIGIQEKNIVIGNCYSDSPKELKEIIAKSDVLLLPGGNPEMFFKKVVQDTELLCDIKHYKGIIIGESAGTELQLKRYFITAKNNYYKHFAFYDGFGIIDDPFYMDVHTVNNHFYLKKLQSVAKEKQKTVYAIYDDGVILYNRDTKKIELFGNVKIFKP